MKKIIEQSYRKKSSSGKIIINLVILALIILQKELLQKVRINVLLNQSVIAGLGNIYVSEILHVAGISPNRSAKYIKRLQAKRLAEAISEVLSAAIRVGGSSLQDYRTPLGELGFFQNEFRVYGRMGKNCMKCMKNSKIKKIIQANRSTFYCPLCQR